jgi:hypothetical protein
MKVGGGHPPRKQIYLVIGTHFLPSEALGIVSVGLVSIHKGAPVSTKTPCLVKRWSAVRSTEL